MRNISSSTFGRSVLQHRRDRRYQKHLAARQIAQHLSISRAIVSRDFKGWRQLALERAYCSQRCSFIKAVAAVWGSASVGALFALSSGDGP